MITKRILFTSLLTILAAHLLNAQEFNELIYGQQKSTFRLFAPNTAKKVFVRLYTEGMGGKPFKTVRMKKTADERWTAEVKGKDTTTKNSLELCIKVIFAVFAFNSCPIITISITPPGIEPK